MEQSYKNSVATVKAITVLHNILVKKIPKENVPKPRESGPSEECGMAPINVGTRYNNAGTMSAKAIREKMAEYFYSGNGQVDFQWEKTFG